MRPSLLPCQPSQPNTHPPHSARHLSVLCTEIRPLPTPKRRRDFSTTLLPALQLPVPSHHGCSCPLSIAPALCSHTHTPRVQRTQPHPLPTPAPTLPFHPITTPIQLRRWPPAVIDHRSVRFCCASALSSPLLFFFLSFLSYPPSLHCRFDPREALHHGPPRLLASFSLSASFFAPLPPLGPPPRSHLSLLVPLSASLTVFIRPFSGANHPVNPPRPSLHNNPKKDKRYRPLCALSRSLRLDPTALR